MNDNLHFSDKITFVNHIFYGSDEIYQFDKDFVASDNGSDSLVGIDSAMLGGTWQLLYRGIRLRVKRVRSFFLYRKSILMYTVESEYGLMKMRRLHFRKDALSTG